MTLIVAGRRLDVLLVALLIYSAASLAHFAHNAAFADLYPNLPESLTPWRIIMAWLVETSIGFTGYVLVRRGWVRTGLSLMCLYAALGFDGFAHYSLAPMSAHTAAMNVTIWAEAVAGAGLLLLAGTRLLKALPGRSDRTA